MLTEIDQRASAFVNLEAVVGAPGELCARVPEARALAEADADIRHPVKIAHEAFGIATSGRRGATSA